MRRLTAFTLLTESPLLDHFDVDEAVALQFARSRVRWSLPEGRPQGVRYREASVRAGSAFSQKFVDMVLYGSLGAVVVEDATSDFYSINARRQAALYESVESPFALYIAAPVFFRFDCPRRRRQNLVGTWRSGLSQATTPTGQSRRTRFVRRDRDASRRC